MNRLSHLSCRWLLFFLVCSLVLGVIPPAQSQQETAPSDGNPVGVSYDLRSVESRQQAASALMAEATHHRQAGDAVALVRTLNHLGEVHLKLNDKDPALADVREAIPLARQSGDETLLVDTLTFSAFVYRSRQDTTTALRLLDEAHALSLRLKYRRGEAQSLTELGATYFQKAELTKAETANSDALEIWRELQDKDGEARALLNSGETFIRLGKAHDATAALETAAAIWHAADMLPEQASALLDLNFLAIRQGQWQKALTLLNEAQALVKDKEAEPYISGQIAMSMGEVYEAYGQLETALSYFQEALILYRDHARDESAVADASRKAGHVQARIGDYVEAVQQIEQGMRLAEKNNEPFMVALCHEELGKVYLGVGIHGQARQEFLAAIAHYTEKENPREWARAHSFLGQTDYVQGDLVSAANSYRKALSVFQKIGDYTNEAALCFGLGKLELEEGNLDAAGKYLERSIALTEQLRENAASKDLRSSFLDSVHDRYETYVEWLMQRHAEQPDKKFNVAALEASEMGRARSLLDSLKDYQRELRHTADPSLLVEEEKLQNKEQQLLDKQAKLRSEGSVTEDGKNVENELMQVRAQNETLQAQINSTARFNDLMRPVPLKFEEIRKQVTDQETSLLEYSLGSRKSYLWVITPDGFDSYELAGKDTIEQAASKLINLLSKPQTGAAQEAELRTAINDLSRILLGPVADKLHSHRLIIVADGILQYIPFRVLTIAPDADDLGTKFEIVNEPSASTLALVQQEAANRPAAPKLLAAFGAPVFASNYASQAPASSRGQTNDLDVDDDEPPQQQLPRGVEDKPEATLNPNKVQPLFFAKQELNELRKLASADEPLIYSGFDATRENLRHLDLSEYRILHFATHGLFNSKQPELSGLVLSLVDRKGQPVSGFVGLSDIYNLRARVDLVVLSACSTALGKEARGEGLIGLTRGFMYAGASTVVATLWNVNDKATTELMKRFYINMLQRGMTPAEALRAAQNSIRQEPQWKSPYYWAAFTLQGEYRQIIKSTPAVVRSTSSKIIVGGILFALLAGGVVWGYRRRRRGRAAQRLAGYSTMKK
jgi:CHAT domain-containing protein